MKILVKALAILLAFVVLFPFIYAFMGSFFSAGDFTSSPAKFIPTQWKWQNYTKIFQDRYFPNYVVNSVITGLLSAAIRMVIALLSAYAFSYFRFPGKDFLFTLLMLTLFIPSDLLLVGNYRTVMNLGLLDSYLGIISTSLLPASQILMLRQFFRSIPSSIHDAAMLDGAGDFIYITRILFPVSKAIVSTFALQSFVGMFNSYLWPLLVTNTPSMRTVQIGITMLGYAESLNYGPIFAAIVVIFIPFLAIFILMRKRIMNSLKQGYMFM